MKIAAIVITYNDDYKFKEWCRWYEEYKDQIALYIIVDNNSKPEYRAQVESFFKDAHIIKRASNGGCTSAYNDGIRYALSQPEITHIALMGNDMRLEKDCLPNCVSFMETKKEIGMVSPIITNADSDKVFDFGDSIDEHLTMIPLEQGKKIDKIQLNHVYCDCVPGGMNVAKRSFYEIVGLQDENLFMYSDEVDMALRARKKGIIMAATSAGRAWHQHIKSPVVIKRHPYSSFLIARNKVYVAFKHFGRKKALKLFNHFFFGGFTHYIANVIRFDFNRAQMFRWGMIGAWKGITRNMKPNKYSSI